MKQINEATKGLLVPKVNDVNNMLKVIFECEESRDNRIKPVIRQTIKRQYGHLL